MYNPMVHRFESGYKSKYYAEKLIMQKTSRLWFKFRWWRHWRSNF